MCLCVCVCVCVCGCVCVCVCVCVSFLTLRALYVRSTSKCSSEQRHDLISTTFQCCSNVRCPLGKSLF